jgi:hypothetical protein
MIQRRNRGIERTAHALYAAIPRIRDADKTTDPVAYLLGTTGLASAA